MADISQKPSGFKFGVEIECYIQPSEPYQKMTDILLKENIFGPNNLDSPAMTISYWLQYKYRKWRSHTDYDIALSPKDYVKALAEKKAPTPEEMKKLKKDYAERKGCWGIEQDSTLDKVLRDDVERIFPLEFVSSPIEVDFTLDNPFKDADHHIKRFFQFFTDTNIKVHTRPGTSTHVHLSPLFQHAAPLWTAPLVKSVGMCSLWFEPAIRYLLPTERRFSPFAREYRDNKFWTDDKVPRPLDLPSDAEHYKEMLVAFTILDNVAPVPGESSLVTISKKLQSGSGGSERYAGWNYWNIYNKKSVDAEVLPIGTIEFREPPGSSNADDVIGWIKFAVTFGYQSCHYGDALHHAVMSNDEKVLRDHYLCSEAGIQDFLSQNHVLQKADFKLQDFILKQWEFVRWAGKERKNVDSMKEVTPDQLQSKMKEALEKWQNDEDAALALKHENEKAWKD